MKLELSDQDVVALNNGSYVTVKRTVKVPGNIMGRLKILNDYPIKNRSLLNGICGNESIPLIVGMVRLNLQESCIEFDVYSQHEVLL